LDKGKGKFRKGDGSTGGVGGGINKLKKSAKFSQYDESFLAYYF